MENRNIPFPCWFFILFYKMALNRKFKNQWEKLHKMFHLIETLDFSFTTEFQNPENHQKIGKIIILLWHISILLDIVWQKYLVLSFYTCN